MRRLKTVFSCLCDGVVVVVDVRPTLPLPLSSTALPLIRALVPLQRVQEKIFLREFVSKNTCAELNFWGKVWIRSAAKPW